MNKNLILSSHITNEEFSTLGSTAELKLIEDTVSHLNKSVRKVIESTKQPAEWLRKYYSIILEKEISMRQTLLLVGTQAAFCLAIFPADIHLLLRLISLIIFCVCLGECKRSL